MRYPKCVRCGRTERVNESYLCSRCFDDPKRRTEQRAVERTGQGDYREMRRTLIDKYNWFGGWTRHDTEGQT